MKIRTEIIKKAMDGRTQASVADKIGASRQSFNTWLNTEHIPRAIYIFRLAKVLKLKVTDIVDFGIGL
jgi:DNA-binding XRE family transcriptional regulator